MGGMKLEERLEELKYKEVIDMGSGTRYGYPKDVTIDLATGQVTELIIPGQLRLFGLLGREEDIAIPWSRVRRVGEDIILVGQ